MRFKNVKSAHSEEPKNIIVYSGSKHTKNYEEYLEQLDFQPINRVN
jgi:hypothetical protein